MDLKVSKRKKLLRLLILFLIFYLILFFAFVIKSFQTGRKLTTNDFVGKTYVDEQSTYYMYFSDENRLFFKELKNLEARDKEIMIMRYGLYNTKEYTQKEVADKLSISQSYISRIEKKVIKKLKTLLRFS